jgi:replicative DNA helicase
VASFPQLMGESDRPVSMHAEMTVLGAMLLEPEAIYQASEYLTTTDFALSSHREIYGAILSLVEEGTPVDLISLGNILRMRNSLDAVGGLPYLADLTYGIPRKLSVESYVRIIRDKAVAREGLSICDRYSIALKDQNQESGTIIHQMQLELMELSSAIMNKNRAETVGEIAPRVLKQILEERDNRSTDDALGYTYGVPDLDRMTKGMFPNEYTIILAETGGAKTAWLTQIILDNALKGRKAKLFSMEMTKEQMVRRMFAALSILVRAKDIRDPRFMGIHEAEDLIRTSAKLEKLGISIDGSRQLPLDQMLARARVAIQRDDAKIIAVDYLQLMRAPTTYKHMSDTERIEMVTLALRDLAADSAEYGAHVLALSQYSRPADGARGRPTNSRAKGSSSLEQSCQVMLHVVREQLEDRSLSNDVEIIIGKQREGKFGTVRAVFDEDHLRLKGVTA